MEWRPVKNFSNYEVSEYGDIRNIHSKRILVSVVCNSGYLRLMLCEKNSRTNVSVHRIVAEAFVPNPENKPQVNHKDENKLNNNCANLEWVTHRENSIYGTGLKRQVTKRSKPIKSTDEQGNETFYESMCDAERKGFGRTAVRKCLNSRNNKTFKGFYWDYA